MSFLCCLLVSYYLCTTKHQEQLLSAVKTEESKLTNRVTGNHGGKVTMWKYQHFIFNFKHYPDMINNPFYAQFSARFAEETLQSLIQTFNNQVGNRGWSSARAYHDRALIDELKRRGINLSAVSNGGGISFAHKVELNANGTALQIIK